jgi:hypothetical protein
MKQDITHISQEIEITAQEPEENIKMISPTYKEISNIIDKLQVINPLARIISSQNS